MNKDLEVFEKYFPNTVVDYCFQLWKDNQFKFKITSPRQSKLGDYSYRPLVGHKITVNGDLNPYAFLVTYIHEVAHLITFNKYGNKPNPHGKEWKRAFKEIFQPLLNKKKLPEAVEKPLIAYLLNPGATTYSCKPLMSALRAYDVMTDEQLVSLLSLPIGNTFQLNGRVFIKGELRRTRFLCTDRTNGKRYVVSSNALVKQITA